MITRAFEILSRRIDGPLMAALALTIALGITVVYSASGGAAERMIVGQGRNLAVALAAMWVFAHIHPQLLLRLALPVYVVGLALLVENGGSGSGTAAPIAREVFDYYLLGKRNPARQKLDPDS